MKVKPIILLILLFPAIFLNCERSSERRKIKLSDQNIETKTKKQLTSTIYFEPTLRRAVAVMFFENKTGDENLAWLQKGLTEMFIRALSQSRHLSVLSTERLYEILERLKKSTSNVEINFDMAAIVAQEANVEALLTGNIIKKGDSLQINVKVHEANNGRILKEESIEGFGLENIFSMVDNLTQRIKNDLKISLEKDEASRGIAELSTNSLDAWRYYTSGFDLMNKYLLSEAIVQFEKAVELDSTFVSSYLNLCPLFYNQGETQQGYQVFQKLLTLKNKATSQEKYQIELLEAGLNRDIRKRIKVSHQWLQKYPDDRDANLNLGNIYFGLQNYDQAIHYFQKVLTIDPKFKNAYNMLGYVYANTGDFSNATATLNQYKELAPDEPNPYDSMGEIYLYQGDYKNAEKQFKQAIKVNNNYNISWLNLGNTYLDKGKYKKALKIFNQALKKATNPADKASVHTQIGFTQWRLGQTEEAITNFKKSLQHHGYRYLVMTWLNEVFKDYHDDAGRIQSLKQNYTFVKELAKTYPMQLTTLANLSLWYDINVEETISEIKNILKITNNPAAKMWGRFSLVLLYLKTNQLDEYKKLSEDFTKEFIEIIKAAQDVPLTYSIWRNFSIFNQYAYQFNDEGIKKYNQLIKFCLDNDLKITEMVFRLLLADLYYHTGESEKARQQLKIVGAPEENKWMVIGPFDNKNGFNNKFPPEKKIKLNKVYKSKSQLITWQHVEDGFQEGYIDLQKVFKIYNWSVGYGLIYVNSPDKKDVQLRIGSNDAVKIWLNNKLVWKFNIGRDSIFDDDIINVTLNPGPNKILIKVCNRISLWGFYFRITDEDGNGVPDIQYVSADEIDR